LAVETARLDIAREPRASTREKLCAFLESRPAGADARELVGLLLAGAGSDPELAGRIIHTLLASDPNFVFDTATSLWSLRSCAALRVALSEASFCVVDLETTGGRAGPGTIIEIGAYRMVGRRMVESFETLVRPQGPIPRFISGLTSISNEMVAAAPPIEKVLPAFRDFLGPAVLVAHNATFDFSFLNFEFRRIFGIGLRNPILCTLRMARRFVPSLKRRRLDSLAEHFGLSTAGRHRGLGDARMAAEILSIFLEIAENMGIGRLDRLLDLHGRGPSGRRLERHVSPQDIAALPLAPGVYLMRNARGDLLYVGKARRLRERVGSYFAAAVNAKTAELISHVYSIETRVTRSALEAGLLELAPDPDRSPCLYGQMGHCCAPCNAGISADAYGVRVRRALAFLQGRAGQLLRDLAGARDKAASALRYEEAARLRRDLESLVTLSHRASRLSQVITENNLVIVTGRDDDRAAHVVLSGRLALTRKLDSPAAGAEVRAFVIQQFESYKAKPVTRDELEPMQIVRGWLGERTPDEGRLIYLSGPDIETWAIETRAEGGAAATASLPKAAQN